MGVCDEDEKKKALAFIARYPCIPSLTPGVQQLRNRLHLAHAGKNLMHETAKATGSGLRTLAREITETCQCFREDMSFAYILLARARYYNPYLHDIVLNNLPTQASVTVETCIRTVGGVDVREIQITNNFYRLDNYAHLGIGRGGETVRAVKCHWNRMIEKLICMCHKRVTFEQLDKASRGAYKQTMVLHERVIPNMNSNITACVYQMEELKRDQLYRMKILAKNFRIGEYGSKGVSFSTITNIMQDMAKRDKLRCNPECPFDCPKIDPLSMTRNSVFNMKENNICFARTECGNREQDDNEDFCGCPAACIKMFENMLAEDNNNCKATSPKNSKKEVCTQQEILQELKRASMFKYSPPPGIKKCQPCRDEQTKFDVDQLKELARNEVQDRMNKTQKEQERLEKVREKVDKEERRLFLEDEKNDYKKNLEKLSSISHEVAEKNKVSCSTSPIEDFLPCPHCRAKTHERPPLPHCSEDHVTTTNTNLVLGPKYDIIHPETDTFSQQDCKSYEEKPRLIDAQEETGLVTQSSVYKLEVNYPYSATEKTSNEDINAKSEFTETLKNEPCETKKYTKGLISQTTSIDGKLSPCPFCHVFCPRVDATPCPHCHMVYRKTPGEVKKNAFLKPTLEPQNRVVATCSDFYVIYPDSVKKVTPTCHSASTSTKNLNVLSCADIRTLFSKVELEVKRSVCCSPKKKGSISFSTTTSPASGPPDCPICTGKKTISPEIKSKENKPICCSRTTSTFGLECCTNVCPKSAKDCCNKCPEKKKGSWKMKSKEEKPKLCSKTTSPAKRLPFNRLDYSKKKTTTTSPVDSECKGEKPKYRSNTTSPANILTPDCPVCTENEKPNCCSRPTSPIDLECGNKISPKSSSKCPEKKVSYIKGKLTPPIKYRCQDTGSIKTSTITIDHQCKATTVDQKTFGLEDFTIDETGKVVVRKYFITEEGQRNNPLSIKEVIDKGEEEFRKIQQLREALNIPCTHSEPCTQKIICQKARNTSVVAQTSIPIQRSAYTGERDLAAASDDFVVKQAYRDRLYDPVSELKIIKLKLIDATCETNRKELDKGTILSKKGEEEFELRKSFNRPIIASCGVLDFPTAVTSVNVDLDNMSEKLEKIHVYLSESPAYTSLSGKKIMEWDGSYAAEDSFRVRNDVFCMETDNFLLDNGNNSYADNENPYAEKNNYNEDDDLKVAYCKRRIEGNAKGKWAQILIHSFTKVRIKPRLKDTEEKYSSKSLHISGHKLKL